MYRAGTYYAEKVSVAVGETEKGTPYVALEIKPKHYAVNGSWEDVPDPEPRTIFFYLSDKAAEFSIEKLRSIGFNGKFGEGEADVTGDANGGFNVECKLEVYNGKERDKWDLSGFGGGGLTHTPPASEKIRHLNNLWNAANPQGAKRPPAPPAAAKPIPATTPFD